MLSADECSISSFAVIFLVMTFLPSLLFLCSDAIRLRDPILLQKIHRLFLVSSLSRTAAKRNFTPCTIS